MHSVFFGSGGVPPKGGLGPQPGRFQEPGPFGPVRGGDPASFHEKRFWGLGGPPQGGLGPQAGRFQGPGASWTVGATDRGGSRQPFPKSRSLPCFRAVREAKCLLGALASRRAAGTGREDPQPDSNPFQLRFFVKRTFSAKLRGEAKSKKAPLEGGWGVNPKP